MRKKLNVDFFDYYCTSIKIFLFEGFPGMTFQGQNGGPFGPSGFASRMGENGMNSMGVLGGPFGQSGYQSQQSGDGMNQQGFLAGPFGGQMGTSSMTGDGNSFQVSVQCSIIILRNAHM